MRLPGLASNPEPLALIPFEGPSRLSAAERSQRRLLGKLRLGRRPVRCCWAGLLRRKAAALAGGVPSSVIASFLAPP